MPESRIAIRRAPSVGNAALSAAHAVDHAAHSAAHAVEHAAAKTLVRVKTLSFSPAARVQKVGRYDPFGWAKERVQQLPEYNPDDLPIHKLLGSWTGTVLPLTVTKPSFFILPALVVTGHFLPEATPHMPSIEA